MCYRRLSHVVSRKRCWLCKLGSARGCRRAYLRLAHGSGPCFSANAQWLTRQEHGGWDGMSLSTTPHSVSTTATTNPILLFEPRLDLTESPFTCHLTTGDRKRILSSPPKRKRAPSLRVDHFGNLWQQTRACLKSTRATWKTKALCGNGANREPRRQTKYGLKRGEDNTSRWKNNWRKSAQEK